MRLMKHMLLALSILPVAVQETGPWRIVCESGGKAWSVRENGSDRREEPASSPGSGVLSPDGKRRAHVRPGDDSQSIWVSDADGKNWKSLTESTYFGSLAWTPDGKRLVFAASRMPEKSQIWIIDIDGTNLARLTNHADGASDPQVSPVGNSVCYRERHYRPKEKLPPSTLRTMDLAGRDSKVLIEKTQMQGHAWSPKGDRIACSLVQEIRILEVPSGKTVKSFKLGDVHKDLYAHAAYGMIWRPDGGAIACTIQFLGGRMMGTKIFGDEQIFILPFEGKPVVIEAGGPAGPVRWTR